MCSNKTVATHIFYKLVFSARLFMEKASWGYFVLVFESSAEPAVYPESSDSCATGSSWTEFEVERTTSCKEGADTLRNAAVH